MASTHGFQAHASQSRSHAGMHQQYLLTAVLCDIIYNDSACLSQSICLYAADLMPMHSVVEIQSASLMVSLQSEWKPCYISTHAPSPAKTYCCLACVSTTGSCRWAMVLLRCGSLYRGICIDGSVVPCCCLGIQANSTAGIRLLVGDSDVSGLSLLPSNAAPWSIMFDSVRYGKPCMATEHTE